jgi:hypothetical protein
VRHSLANIVHPVALTRSLQALVAGVIVVGYAHVLVRWRAATASVASARTAARMER